MKTKQNKYEEAVDKIETADKTINSNLVTLIRWCAIIAVIEFADLILRLFNIL